MSLARLMKVKKAGGLLHIPLLVKSHRFCRIRQFKPGFCGFLIKNLFKMLYFAIFNSFSINKPNYAAGRRLHEGEKSFFLSYI